LHGPLNPHCVRVRAAKETSRRPFRLLERCHGLAQIVERGAVGSNYAWGLSHPSLRRFEEARSLLRKTMPVARRVLGQNHDLVLMMRWAYARALSEDPAATLDDISEAVTTLEDADQIARRIFGGAHPDVVGIESSLRDARAALHARETPPGGA
jgi:hypothetical protein